MTRPWRNRLALGAMVVLAFALGPRLPTAVTWALAGLVLPLLAVALWVLQPLLRARTWLAKKDYERAATQLAAFELLLTSSAWKRAFARLGVGLYTSSPLAATRNTLGAVRLEQGRLDDAKTHFAAALAHDAGYAIPHANLAIVAARQGDAAEAEAQRAKARALGYAPKLLDAIVRDALTAARPS